MLHDFLQTSLQTFRLFSTYLLALCLRVWSFQFTILLKTKLKVRIWEFQPTLEILIKAMFLNKFGKKYRKNSLATIYNYNWRLFRCCFSKSKQFHQFN